MISFQKYPQLIVAAVLVSILLPLLSASPASASPYCGQVWGSTPEHSWTISTGSIVDVRAGKHNCFDRLVVDTAPGLGQLGYDVKYVDEVRLGSGAVIPTSGGAKLQIVVGSPAYNSSLQQTLQQSEIPSVAGFRTFRDVTYVGVPNAAQTVLGLGVRSRLPFRVFTLSHPDRLVVDVGHRW